MEQCLIDLIGLETYCETGDTAKKYMYLDQIEGISRTTLSDIATTYAPNADSVAEKLLKISAREVATDIETLLPKSYSLKNAISHTCSACTLQPLYSTGKRGILIKNTSGSQYSVLQIDSLNILVNNTGEYNIVIDDGEDDQIIAVELEAGVIQPIINIGYRTFKTSVRIYFEDYENVQVGTVLCESNTGCGCGRKNLNPLKNGFVVTGFEDGASSNNQYGFLPCVSIGCSYDQIICALINMSPRAFAAAMIYKAAVHYYQEMRVSQRNNRTVSYNDEEKKEMLEKYETLYRELLHGNGGRKGIADMISANLGFMNDRCVECNSRVSVSYAHG